MAVRIGGEIYGYINHETLKGAWEKLEEEFLKRKFKILPCKQRENILILIEKCHSQVHTP